VRKKFGYYRLLWVTTGYQGLPNSYQDAKVGGDVPAVVEIEVVLKFI